MSELAGSSRQHDQPEGRRSDLSTVRVLVLGTLVVEHDGRELHVAGTQRRRLLAFLGSRGGRAATSDAIAEALWGETPPPTATKAIQNHVARLRASFASLDRELIETTPGGYRLAVDPEAIDAVAFERRAMEGRRRLAAGDTAAAVDELTDALAFWRGPAYADVADAEYALGEAARLSELRWVATEDLAEAQVERGSFELASADLSRLVQDQPGRERAWGLLIRALYAAGRQRDALAAYQQARRVLVEEFGLEPGPELRALERRVLEQDPELSVRRAPAVPAALRRETNAFVGRDQEMARLREAWRASRAGSGQLRLLLGPVESGRTRLAAELAAIVVTEGGQVVHARGQDGFARSAGLDLPDGESPGPIVDGVVDLSRSAPVLVVLDDAEWSSGATTAATAALASAIPHMPVMLLVIADPSGSGAALQGVLRLDDTGLSTVDVGAMDDELLAALVVADGVDIEGAGAVVAVARGLPGVARREAALWAERSASDRLTAASSSALGANAAAAKARASVFDDVLDLVAARARRDELTSSAWAGRQPYRSLAPYGVQDADLFVGRERQVAELAARVLERRVVAVVGSSGSGKSSLVRAGLVPLVRSGRLPGAGPWRVAVIVPGTDPMATLEAVEGIDAPGSMLLVVDQFEELFASGAVERFASKLVELASDAALDVHVVIVLRGDQYPGLAATRPLAALVEDAQILVGPPTTDELRRIIEVPPRRTGCTVEPALTAQVCADVAGYEAALPLVSAALAAVWEGRNDDTLTAGRYLELGGLAAAVERLGAQAVERAGTDAVRDVMLRLVDITEDGLWVRRRVDANDIPGALSVAVDALVDARLLQRTNGEVDVAHEVVFSAWPLLAGWLEEVRAELILDRDLRSAARAWAADDRGDDYLYRGARLAAASELVAGQAGVDPVVAGFVAASEEAVQREADDRARRQAVVNRRLRRLLAGVGVLLVAALVAGGLAVRQADRADQSAEAARAAATRAEARQAGDRARATLEVDRALLLAVEGVRLDDSPETRANLLAVLSQHPGLIAPERTSGVPFVAANPARDRLVTYADGELAVRDARTLDVVAASDELAGVHRWADLEFSPDGSQLTVLHHSYDSLDGREQEMAESPVVLYDAQTLEPAVRQLGGVPPQSAAQDAAYSGDGRLLAVAFALFRDVDDPDPYASPVLVWDLSAPEAPLLEVDAGSVYNALAMNADGSRLYSAIYPPGDIRAFDTETGALVKSVEGTGGRLAASPDGSTLAVTGLSGQIVVLDAETLSERFRLEGRTANALGSPTFSVDGRLLAAPDWDAQTVYVWDLATGAIVEEIAGQISYPDVVWFGPEGSVHASTDDDTLLTWNIAEDDGHFVDRVPPPARLSTPQFAAPLPGGRIAYLSGLAFSPAPGGTIQLRDPAAATLGDVRSVDHDGLAWLAWRADGRRYATTGQDGMVRVWDTPSGELLAERQVAAGPIATVTYSTDGMRLAIAEDSGAVYAIDAETLAPAGPRVDVGHTFVSAMAGPDDDQVITISPGEPNSIKLVDIERGRVVQEVEPDFVPHGAAVSPDRRSIAVRGAGGEVRIFDVAARDWVGPPVVRHEGNVSWLAWSADSRTVVSTGVDGQVALWDGESGSLLGGLALEAAAGAPLTAVFDGETTMVTALAADGSIYRWDTNPDSWVEFACRVAGRNLTDAEWRDTFGHRPYRQTCS
jgi:DNA-binding SARP family transcriptional activator/WD40 repeat protein